MRSAPREKPGARARSRRTDEPPARTAGSGSRRKEAVGRERGRSPTRPGSVCGRGRVLVKPVSGRACAAPAQAFTPRPPAERVRAPDRRAPTVEHRESRAASVRRWYAPSRRASF
ncbi:MAG TPA: hypothetical protein VGG84_07055 [Gemmatimonadaceae bacterium]